MNTKKLTVQNKPLMIAHRGVSGIEPENTVSAFVAAGNRSYFGIETDVHRTKDGKFVVTHDDNVKRVCGADMKVEESNFDDLRSLNIFDTDKVSHRCDLRIPSLLEYIRICKKYEKYAVLELKNSFSDEDIAKIYAEIDGEGYIDNTIFIAFSIDNLHRVRAISANATVQYLTWEPSDELLDTLRKYNFDLDIHYKKLTKEFVDACHEIGAKVNVWTVDEVADAEKMARCGVDYITSDIVE